MSKILIVLGAFLFALIGTFFIGTLFFTAYTFKSNLFVNANFTGFIYFFAFLALLFLILFGIFIYTGIKHNLIKQKKVWGIFFIILITGIVIMFRLDAYNNNRIRILADEIKPKVQKQENRKFLRPVLRGKAISGNGGDFYLQIIGKKKHKSVFELFDKDDIKKLQDADNNIKPVPAIINKYQKQIDIIRKGTQCEYVKFPIALKMDFQFHNYIMAQNMAKLMIAQAINKCQQGAYKEGIELFLNTLRFGEDISSSGLLIGTMVAVAIENMATKNFGRYLTAKTLTPKEYKYILLQMVKIAPIDIKTSFIDELLLQQAGFIEFLSPNINYPQNISPPASPTFILKPIIIDAISKIELIMKPFIESADMEYYQKKEKLIKNEALEKIIQSNVFTSIAGPNFLKYIEKVISSHTIFYGLYITTALQAYYAQYHKYPTNLEILNTSIVLPVDPFSGKPFIYKLKDSNHYVLYSVGENQTDDGGKDQYYYKSGKQSDIVFSL